MPILEVKGLKKNFGGTEVLKGIDFDLQKGEVLVIIGSSGSGKTTLLRCLNFLETADSGQISVNGEVLFDGAAQKRETHADVRKKRLHFGLVFQQFNLFPHYNALTNIKLASTLLAKEKLRAEYRAIDAEAKSEERKAANAQLKRAYLDAVAEAANVGLTKEELQAEKARLKAR